MPIDNYGAVFDWYVTAIRHPLLIPHPRFNHGIIAEDTFLGIVKHCDLGNNGPFEKRKVTCPFCLRSLLTY
jgi:hypothetical protein